MTVHDFDADVLLSQSQVAEQFAAPIALYGDEDAPMHLIRLLY